MSIRSLESGFKRSALAIAMGLCFAGGVQAQSTTGTLFGTAPAGDTVTVVSETGFTRQASVGSDGRYSIGNLPAGEYSVSVKKGDAVTDTRKILLKVGSGTEANFAASKGAEDLGTVTVTGRSAAIDVSQVDSRVVMTARDLAQLPIGHSAEAIALLAPGAVQGASGIQSKDGRAISTVSFGGAGVTENAYYVNGYNSTDPLGGLGGASMPYGSIAQQETYIGGYSAMYGRSDGGVISQVGKRGTNQWHFGGQIRYSPKSLQGTPKDQHFPSVAMPPAQGANSFNYAPSGRNLPGTLYSRGKGSDFSQTTYDAYIGGPLVPNKLFFFLSAEASKATSVTNPNYYTTPSYSTHSTEQMPKFYGKLDWNINDSNLLELTNIRNRDNVYRDLYAYDFASGNEGAFAQKGNANKISTGILIGKYTSYLSEDLTLSVTYGKSSVHNPFVPGFNDPSLPVILNSQNQNPALNGGVRRVNAQTTRLASSNTAEIHTNGLRVDVSWRLGNHTLTGGIDNMHYDMQNQGRITYGAGYWWNYAAVSDTAKTQPINASLGVGAPNSNYYVSRGVFIEATSSKVDQTAYYLEDAWQVTPNFLLKLGVRNDHFVNRNNLGQPYVDEKQQWAPRLGFAWDMRGDSSLKLYGNVGRYYLALPPSVAIRGASASTNTSEYFTYTGIDPTTGVPTGLAPLGPGPVSSNLEYGTPPDPNTVAARGLKAQYQDEFILGFDQQINSKWAWGVKGLYRTLRAAIDDYCDPATMKAFIGPTAANYDVRGCYIFNPGRTNTFQINSKTGGAPLMLTMTNAQLGFSEGPTRKYVGLDFYLEHPFDGKWSGRIDYTWSRNTGNTEGQVKSDTGQGDTSKTSDWDYAALMVNSSGVLQNDRTHQLKMRGAYQFASEWLLTGAASFMSGRPRNCIGYYGVGEQNPSPGYGVYYHFCGGAAQPPGHAGRTPWTKVINLGLQYKPMWADKKLVFGVDVLNVLNDRVATSTDPYFNTARYTISNTYGLGNSFVTPRRVIFSVTYDY